LIDLFDCLIKNNLIFFRRLNIKPEEDKAALYRVVVLKDKKDEFMNECKKALRIYCKEFNREEIMNMSKEQKSKEELQASIAAKKVFFLIVCLLLIFNLKKTLAKIQNEP
jgi:hypothetical protein